RVARSLARGLLPLHVVAPTLRAERTRVEVVLVARVAMADEELAFLATVPERLRLHVGRRDVETGRGHAQLPGRTATASPWIFASPFSLTTAHSSTISLPARFSVTAILVLSFSPGQVCLVKRTRYDARLPTPT